MKVTSTVLLVLGSLLTFSANAKGDPSTKCLTDLKSLPDFLLTNDTGAPAHLEQKGQAHFDKALADALSEAKQVKSLDECRTVIQSYLRTWRSGHLQVIQTSPTPSSKTEKNKDATAKPHKDTRLPSIQLLSEQTALLKVPSFGPNYRNPLEKLLSEHHDQLAKRSNWIIDVRGNGGGADSTYEPLLPWMMPDGWQEVGIEWLVTPTNIQA